MNNCFHLHVSWPTFPPGKSMRIGGTDFSFATLLLRLKTKLRTGYSVSLEKLQFGWMSNHNRSKQQQLQQDQSVDYITKFLDLDEDAEQLTKIVIGDPCFAIGAPYNEQKSFLTPGFCMKQNCVFQEAKVKVVVHPALFHSPPQYKR